MALNEEQARRLHAIVVERGREGLGDERYAQSIAMLREFAANRSDSGPRPDPRIDRTPLPTGIERIDRAGERVHRVSPSGNLPTFFEDIPSLDDLEADNPLRIRKQRADEGVDMTSGSGLSVGDRASIALSPNIARLRSNRIAEVLGDAFDEIPDDLPKFRYDVGLDEFQILRPSEPGKFRWTSLDGTGLELGDLGDLLNLGEIGSLAGGVVGAGKGKVFSFLNRS